MVSLDPDHEEVATRRIVRHRPVETGRQGVEAGCQVSGSLKTWTARKTQDNLIYGSSANSRVLHRFGDSDNDVSRFFYSTKAKKDNRFFYCRDCNAVLPWRDYRKHDKDHDTCYHVTVKPLRVMEWLVKMITPPEGIILDPFMGTGTTGVAAVKNGFEFRGCDFQDFAVKVSRHRLDAAMSETKPTILDMLSSDS